MNRLKTCGNPKRKFNHSFLCLKNTNFEEDVDLGLSSRLELDMTSHCLQLEHITT